MPSADQASEGALLSNLPPSLVWDQDISLLWPLLTLPVFLWILQGLGVQVLQAFGELSGSPTVSLLM